MSKYIDGTSVDLASFSGDDILVVVEQSGQRDTYATINQLRALLDTLPIVGGTANGVAYLNASKVLTTGSALVFDGTSLTVGGGTGIFKLNASSSDYSMQRLQIAGTTYGSFGAGTGGEVVWSANGLHLWNVASSEAMRLTSTGLGIGTSSPLSRLTISADNAGGGSEQLNITGTNTDNRLRIGYNTASNYGVIQALTANVAYRDLVLNPDGGNLGLGVTPSASVLPSVESEFGILVGRSSLNIAHNAYYGSGGWTYIGSTFATQYDQDNGEHRWYTAPSGTAGNPISFTQAMTLDASGRLLVGTTSNLSGEPLQIDGNGVGSTVYTALIRNTSTSTSVYNMVRWGQNATGSAVGYIGTGGSTVGNPAFQNTFVVGTQTSNALVFNTNDAERARIPAAGGMVIGTAALATTATDGFMYVPTCAGTPTGTPTAQTGTAPIVVDTTNNKLYFYSGGSWVAAN